MSVIGGLVSIVAITKEIMIHAPIEVCFDAARDVGLHPQTVWPRTRERTLPGGRLEGLMEKNEIVVFEAVHFGIRQQLTSLVEELDKPYLFVDRMQKGAFRHMMHRHEFERCEEGTLVRDILEFASPFGPAGRLFDALVLRRYMLSFINYRQRQLKSILENGYATDGQRSDSSTSPR
ncbi:polyketide cyclase/dehydrase and lipid transport protein [Saccharibacillus sacchari DSM 19268]|uniref:Polyketide cyclase/dehydrase and lipid transport protein n=1 Tax=Saccharibacillus sacchari DSM 19268 TaxID=915437 RepID=A0A011A1C0_9BACL|nr:polyketide cyclase/dehydrase and lipid transport protein [Saccharibacillus sacchari DSM 19268]